MTRQQYQIRMEPGLREQLRQLIPERLNVSYVIEMFPGLYRRAVAQFIRDFSAAELAAMRDALSSCYLTPGLAGQHIVADLDDGIRLDDIAGRHGIDGDALLARLRAMPLANLAMLEIWLVSET